MYPAGQARYVGVRVSTNFTAISSLRINSQRYEQCSRAYDIDKLRLIIKLSPKGQTSGIFVP